MRWRDRVLFDRWLAAGGDLTFSEWLDQRRAAATFRREEQRLYRSSGYQAQMLALQSQLLNSSQIQQQQFAYALQNSRVGQAIPIPVGLLGNLGGWLK